MPETAQRRQCSRGQGHEAIPVALRVADMHPLALGVEIPDLQPQPFSASMVQLKRARPSLPVLSRATASSAWAAGASSRLQVKGGF